MNSQTSMHDEHAQQGSNPWGGRPPDWLGRVPGDPATWAADRLAARRLVRTLVHSGYMRPSDVQLRINELDFDVPTLQALSDVAGDEFAQLERTRQSWPERTDCDRLDSAFNQLRRRGVCAVSNAGIRCADSFLHVVELIAEAPVGTYHGYCYCHLEDIAWCIARRGLMLSFGSLDASAEGDAALALTILQQLRAAGLSAHCAGAGDPIWLSGFEWRRRPAAPSADCQYALHPI